MGEKNLRFDFGKQDIWNMNGRLSYVEGWERIVQEISLELDTYKGDMPEDPEYGSILKGALNSSNISDEMKKEEVQRIANKHPEVEKAFTRIEEDGSVYLSVKLVSSLGGGVESTNF